MVRVQVFLHNFHLLLPSDDQKSFKLEYLSVGPNQPDAFTISVNPLIPFHPPLLFLLEHLADDFVPRCS